MAKTGYKIITYIDVNPMSPTFQTTRTERVADADCDAENANWQEVSRYCELDESLQNTGYEILTEMDVNIDSPTYGQTRETRSMNLLRCPLKSTDPHWVIDTEESYCETKVFPSGLEGNTGIYVLSMTDENDASATFNQTITSSITESDWTEELEEEFGEFPCEAVDTEPKVEVITSNCVLEVGEDGQLHTNGYEEVTGIDRNPYSMSYLSAVTIVRENEERCPRKQTVITVYAESDKYMLDGTSAATFTIHYYAMADSSKITDGVVLESIPLEADEEAFPYTVASSGTDNIGNYISYNVEANNVNRVKTAKFKAVYNGKYSNLVAIKQSGREMVILPDFDYLTFTFNWNEADGKDLDSATFVEGTNYIISGNNRTAALDDCPVGYGCKGSDRSFSANTRQYLEYGGDNRNSGDECALVNWKTICNHDFISEGITTLYCNLYANWYEEKTNGNCSVTFKTYKGEGMQHGGMVDGQWNEYVFVPSGNTELVSTQTITGSCYAFSSNNSRQRYYSPTADEKGYYSYIAEFVYDIQTKTAFMSNKMLSISGRELKKYGYVDNVLITGNGSDTLGIATMSYDTAARTVTINNIKDFHVVATTPNESITEQATAYTMSLSFDPSGTEWATATYENNTLVVNMDENDSGRIRTAEVTIVGKTLLSDVEYRFRLRQNLY